MLNRGLSCIAVLAIGVVVACTSHAAEPGGTNAPADTTQRVALDEILQAGFVDWSFSLGTEFKGATGEATLVTDATDDGKNAIRAAADFTAGGRYVALSKALPIEPGLRDYREIRLRVRTDNCRSITLRITDSSGQTHQRKGIKLTADGTWQDLVITPATVAGGEHWGGAKDGTYHAPATHVALILNADSAADKAPWLEITDIAAETVVGVDPPPAPWREGFETADRAAAWTSEGDVTATTGAAYKGDGALRLARTLEAIETRTVTRGPSFPARAGAWLVEGATTSALYSPDNSYHGAVVVEFLNSADTVLASRELQIQTGDAPWKAFSRRVEAPAGTVAGRVRVELRKTYGHMQIDALSAVWMPATAAAEPPISRIMVQPADEVGIFMPDAPLTYAITVLSTKALARDAAATALVTDFWNAEATDPLPIALSLQGWADGTFTYTGELTVDREALRLGKYYQLHVDVPVAGFKAVRHTIGTARLPEAATRQHDPRDIPFTIRNWDSRIAIYFKQADRIGIRQVGVWGGWKKDAPYPAHLPGLALTQELGLQWITGTPGALIERGATDWSEEALREGMTNFLKAYADKGLSAIALGNEPHGGPEQIAKNIAAYKILYEAIKAYDPDITVIATSVEPNPEYFRQGFYKYCDMYDFHTYQSYHGVRTTMAKYRELMEEYDAVKPIVSTELGLNSQGMSRRAVAMEMVKKFAVFFGEGGEHVSWFTMQYPDPTGEAANGFGQAHCVFDSRYRISTPKLDAITYYHMVNGIANRRIVETRSYDGGVEGFLFRNATRQGFAVLWSDHGRREISLPAGHSRINVMTLDGDSFDLAAGEQIGLTIDAEPVLITVYDPTWKLPESLAASSLALASEISPGVPGQTTSVQLTGPGLTAAALRVQAPRGWSATLTQAGADTVACTFAIPAGTEAAAGNVTVFRMDGERARAACTLRIPVEESYTAVMVPQPATADAPGAITVHLSNHGQEPVTLRWHLSLVEEYPMARGRYSLSGGEPTTAYFTETSDGSATLAPGEVQDLRVPIAAMDPQTLYVAQLRITGEDGRQAETRRFISGLQQVARAKAIAVDGALDEAEWQATTVARIHEERQVYPNGKRTTADCWTDAADLSAEIRYLWDDEYLYIGAVVTDDTHVADKRDGTLWNMDGLQFLVDVNRAGKEKSGQYDISFGHGTKGPQIWCHTSGHSTIAAGEITTGKLTVVRDDAARTTTYEFALPWARLAPFQPRPGANIGLALIANDNDGDGRYFVGWFSGVHSKQLDMLGDLILTG